MVVINGDFSHFLTREFARARTYMHAYAVATYRCEGFNRRGGFIRALIELPLSTFEPASLSLIFDRVTYGACVYNGVFLSY